MTHPGANYSINYSYLNSFAFQKFFLSLLQKEEWQTYCSYMAHVKIEIVSDKLKTCDGQNEKALASLSPTEIAKMRICVHLKFGVIISRAFK